MQINKLFLISFSLYLGLSPIYWIPYAPPIIFSLIKYFLFSFICIYTLIFNLQLDPRFKINIPGKYIFLTLTLGMLTLVFLSFLLGSNESNLNMLINFIQIIFFVIAARTVIHLDQVLYVIKLSLNILSIFVILSVICMFLIPQTPNSLNSEYVLINSGFGGSRTGWSPAIGLFIPFIFYIYGSIALLSIYLISQLLTGGRAGFYLSTILLLPLLYTQKGWRFKTRFIIILFFLSIAILVYSPSFLNSLRVFDSLTQSSDLDTLSSGRVGLIQDAWHSILDKPVLGHATKSTFLGEAVHNVYLRGWLYYGIFYFIFSILLIIYTLIQSIYKVRYSKDKKSKQFFIVSTLVIIYGVIIGMVEPSIIYGNFTNFSIWWFVFALVVSKDYISVEPNLK